MPPSCVSQEALTVLSPVLRCRSEPGSWGVRIVGVQPKGQSAEDPSVCLDWLPLSPIWPAAWEMCNASDDLGLSVRYCLETNHPQLSGLEQLSCIIFYESVNPLGSSTLDSLVHLNSAGMWLEVAARGRPDFS